MLENFLHGLASPHRRLVGGTAAAVALTLGVAFSAPVQAQTLVTWDDYTDVGQNAVIEQLNKNFVAAHPGVTINRTARTFDDLSMTLKLSVSAGNGPEVTKVNQGAADQGTMVKQHLLLPPTSSSMDGTSGSATACLPACAGPTAASSARARPMVFPASAKWSASITTRRC